jgi:hypothetical protein
MGVTDASQIGPGLAGFLTMFVLAIAVVLLVRSMVGHLRKVRYSPDPSAEPPTAQRPPVPPAVPPAVSPAVPPSVPPVDGDAGPDAR